MRRRQLAALTLLFLTAGELRPIVDRTFPLEQAARAQEQMAKAEQFGKIVLQIPPLS